MTADLAAIRAVAEGHDHFLVERPVRELAWFALSVIDALDAAASCWPGDPGPYMRGRGDALHEIRAAIARNLEARRG